MTRRDMVIQATLVLGLVCGIVGGNFVLHRWVIGSAASREANAETSTAAVPLEDLDEFAPRPRTIEPTAADDQTIRQELLRKLIAAKLPQASAEVLEAWFEELSDVSLKEAEGILDLRSQVGAFPKVDNTARPRTSNTQPFELLNLSIEARHTRD